MQEIEKTLRDTLRILGDPDEPMRQKLYKTTEGIFERNLQSVDDADPDLVIRRRQELKDLIARVEKDFLAGITSEKPLFDTPEPELVPERVAERNAPPLDQTMHPVTGFDLLTAPAVAADPNRAQTVEDGSSAPDLAADIIPSQAPLTQTDRFDNPESILDTTPEKSRKIESGFHYAEADLSAVQPSMRDQAPIDALSAAPTPPDQPTDQSTGDPTEQAQSDLPANGNDSAQSDGTEHQARKRKKRGHRVLDLIAGSTVSVIVLFFIVGGVWMAFESEYYDMYLEFRDGTNAAVPSANLDDRNFVPRSLTQQGSDTGDWIEVFGAQDMSNVRGRGEALIEQVGTGDTASVRIISASNQEAGEAIVPLNGRLLNSGIARTMILSVSIFSEEPTQIYLRAVIRDGVEDVRRRFQLASGQNDILIELDMTNVPSFNAQPFLAINSDITGAARPLNLSQVLFQVQR